MARSRSSPSFMVRSVAISIAVLLFSHLSLVPSPASASDLDVNFDDDEDLSFLEEPVLDHTSSTIGENVDSFDLDSEEDLPDFDSESEDFSDPSDSSPTVDEKDVVVLTNANFTDFISKSKHVMVEFYAPWCGHCQALAPEYAEAATALKEQDQGIFLAKVDANEESDLGQKYDVQGFPTILFFIDGVHKPYNGQRTKEGIVTWINSKLGPSIHNITTIQEAEKILASGDKLVLGFLDSLTGADSQELSSASQLEDGINFYQTVDSDVAKLFNIDPKSKRPSLVLLKKEVEKISHLDGPFTTSGIADFVSANKLPLVITFTMESASSIFESPIKKQLLMFATLNGSDKVIPVFEEVAKSFKGKIIFVFVEMDNEEFGVPVVNYFGITGEGPKVLAFSGNEDSTKYFFEGDELTVENIKGFSEDFLQDKLKPTYKSDPIPETNDGDVKVVVGENFDEIVLDESKDVLLEIYAPWCGHCQSLEPIYNKLALHLRSIESLVIAKMDGTTNEHPRAKADGFPTLLFYPAGNKSFEPITAETDRTVVALYKFIKKHASIPFKLQKPAVKPESNFVDAAVKLETKASTDNADLKDEL